MSQNLDMDIAPHDIEKSHRIGQSRQPREKPRPIIVRFVRYIDRNKIFRNKKNLEVKNFDNWKSYSKQNEKLKEARELHGFRHVWTNDDKIFCKLEDNDKPQLSYG